MAKANMRYKKIEDSDAKKWIEVLLAPSNWDKHTFDEMLLVQHYAQKYEDYWFTWKQQGYYGRKELLIADEPNVKLEGNLLGVYATYRRKQFNLERYIHGGSNGWSEVEGLLPYLERRKERGEDTLFQEQVDECVRRLKLNYEKNTLRGLKRFTEENVTEEYIRERLKKHLISVSQGSGNGFSTSWVDYTMFLQRKDVDRWSTSVPILKPKPSMSAEDITTFMRNGMSVNTLKRDGFSDKAVAAAIPKAVEHHWGTTVQGIKLAETGARNWCTVWIELIGDEEE